MDTKQAHATDLKPGKYVVFDGKPCVVKSVQTSRPGKHGHAKCRIEAVSLIDTSKIIKIMPGHDKVDIPIIQKKTAQVLSIANNKATVMDAESYETFDLDIPEEMEDNVKEGADVTYWIMLGQKVMK
jgi:translation initiation factor 5A